MTVGDSWDRWSVIQGKGIVGSPMPNREPRAFSTTKSTAEHVLTREATEWFVRLGAPKVSTTEREAFEHWRSQSDAHARAFREVTSLWNEIELETAAADACRSIPDSARESAWPWSWQWATAAALVLICGYAVLFSDLWLRWQADVSTVVAEQRSVELPDHSTAFLNSDSAIALDFTGATRVVRLLKGEVLFTVRSDPDRPFIVKSGSSMTRAVGTAFVVRSRGSDAVVTVTKGIVEVSKGGASSAPVWVERGQQVSTNAGGVGAVEAVDLDVATAWVQGRLVFVRSQLSDVLDEVRRYYPGYVLLLSSDAGRVPVTGIYKVSDPAHVFATLAESLQMKMTRFSDRLIILR
ncbi:putative Iron dicitrate transmembrane sensor FecR [Nitrospira japonica]|uniref:Putative Iron dicitrate transmembrane sensor FecR n=1 Tax=Nitrospira japonica TaxID=1325564 RepID=A0A1W1IAT2_9BACT|nr:FecR family protein [Nitrospira japonica]SLM50106.1 putative Iron dicitrate transmembrane sensor FecR [Nitrospira japonica]